MGLTERVWDAFARTIRLADKVEQLTATVAKQQHHIEDLTGRVIRLETAFELALGSNSPKKLSGPSSSRVIHSESLTQQILR